MAPSPGMLPEAKSPLGTPDWMGNCVVEAARGEDGRIIGARISCLVLHDDLSRLPVHLMQSAHRVLDRVAAIDAGN